MVPPVVLAVVLLAAGAVPAEEAPPAVTLAPRFSHAFSQPLRGPVLLREGLYVAVLEDHLEGVDPGTGLVRFSGDPSPLPRRAAVLPAGVLMVGEHLRLFDPGDGRLLWDYPMNCRPGDCNVDVLAFDGRRILVAGFGPRFDQAMILDAATGRDLWPEWVPAADVRLGAVAGERVLLVCGDAAGLVRVVDAVSRRVLASLPSPRKDLSPVRAWYGEQAVMVLGRAEGNDVLVRVPLDGSPGTSAKISSGVDEEGFWAWPDAARFSALSRSGDRLRVWIMDAVTREPAGRFDAAPAARLLPGPEGLVVAETGARELALSLREPRSGALRWRLDLPLAGARVWRQEDRLLAAGGAGDAVRLLALRAEDGALLALGELPPGPGAAAAWLSEPAPDLAAVAAGQTLVVLERRPLEELVASFREALDAGREEDARAAAALLRPFRDGLAAAREMEASFLRRAGDRLLQAAARGEWPRVDQGLGELLTGCTAADRHCAAATAATLNTLVALRRFGPRGARCGVEEIRAAAEWMVAFVEAGSAPDWAPGLGLELAAALADRGALEEGEAVRARLRAEPARAAALDRDGLSRLFRLYGLRGLLGRAREAAAARDWTAAAAALKAFSKDPEAAGLFEEYFEPLMDAASVDLLPEDLLPERLPGILGPLEKALPKGMASALAAAEGDACASRCERALATCEHPCSAPGGCEAVHEACLEGCLERGAAWTLPRMRVPVGSEDFLRCR
ncbi:MAG: PQQ-binding-like beta-propeller repeat protein [Deltaproteobacteria bacterium]|nr:PQQ-binding-like beta-propeller repeat protein [Deltaproteobacteria bacterium]